MDHSIRAAQLFESGYNCAQAVVMAYGDLTGLEESFAAKMASSFGGGMGRMREVCGAVSGMLAVAGILYGYDKPNQEEQKDHYALVQELAGRFRESMGSIICRELLQNPPSDPTPTPRTPEFYATRPCTRMVMEACRILDSYIQERNA